MFFPTGPNTTVYALVLLMAVVACLWHGCREIRHVAGSMFISWIVARSATVFDLLLIQVIGTFLCAWVALMAHNRAGDLVAILFAFKLPVYAMHGLGIAPFEHVEDMWLASEIIAYIQIAIMSLGGLANGGHRALGPMDSLVVCNRGRRDLLGLPASWRRRFRSSR